jgi:hypothetical protein
MVRFATNIGGEPLSETGNWNIAGDYASLKIMKLLYLADEYEIISTFGATNFYDELNLTAGKDLLRVKALDRLISILMMLINNTKFAIVHSSDIETLNMLHHNLEQLRPMTKYVYTERRDEIKKEKYVKIDEEKFSKLLKAVVDIKQDINMPLNKSHLIFISREIYDPREQKKKIIDEAIRRG